MTRDEVLGKCGCGRGVRYTTPSGYACNKYGRCPTYEQLRNSLMEARGLINAYRAKRNVDGLNGRPWDASEHFKAEAMIESMEKEIDK